MSIGLEVKLTKAISVPVLLPNIGTALRDILGLLFIPDIVAEEYVDQTWVPVRSDLLTDESKLIGFLIAGEPETVSIFVSYRGGDDRPENEWGSFAVIEVTGTRTPLIFALTAAVAAALGRECGTDVTDNMPFFSHTLDQSADHFVNAIKVKDQFDDYRAAAKAFYKSLPSHGT